MKRGVLIAVILILLLLLGCSPKEPVPLSPAQEATTTAPQQETQEPAPSPILEETPKTDNTSTQSPAPQETPVSALPPTTQTTATLPTPTPVQTTTPTPSPTPTGPYTGLLFDTHLHLGMLQNLWSAEKLLSLLVSYLDRGKVDWAIGFYELPPDTSNSAVNNRVIPLLSPRRQGGWSQFVSGQFSEAVLRQYLQPQGLFWGVGELVLYESGIQSVTFDSPVMKTVFQVVNEKKGIVMIHPSNIDRGGRPTSLAEIEPSVRKYPDTIFLFHGSSEVFNLIAPLMSKYPNVYFTFDVANWLLGAGAVEGGNPLSDDNAERFLTKVNWIGLKDSLIKRSFAKVAPLFQQYPDRIMWGTDIGSPWHLEEPVVTDVVISLSRELIGRLPADIQKKYAYQNAQRVFGRFLTPSP